MLFPLSGKPSFSTAYAVHSKLSSGLSPLGSSTDSPRLTGGLLLFVLLSQPAAAPRVSVHDHLFRSLFIHQIKWGFWDGVPSSKHLWVPRTQHLLNIPWVSKKHFFFLSLFRAAPTAYGGYQDRGLIGAVAASHSHSHSHSNTGYEPLLWPTPQFTAMPDP